jgi:poly-gamma-glutamate synthesis protein (capsule biosynthesis protein)
MIRLAPFVAAAVALLLVACTSPEAPEATPTTTTEASEPPAIATPAGIPVVVDVADSEGRERIEGAVTASGELTIVPNRATAAATLVISDAPLEGGTPIVLARWAAITDQRRDVLELTRSEVISILRGDITDWSELGGSPLPITPLLLTSQAIGIAMALGIPETELAASRVPDDDLLDRVEREPGTLALVEPEQLRLGVLALVVDGHDPYRDPAADSPLRDARWIVAPPEEVATLAALAGFEAAPPFDPAGMLATGELIPARCSYEALIAAGGMDAMFEGTADAIRAADIAVSPLEVSLTDLSPATPCTPTFILQGPAEAADAMARVGIDVAVTAGNHAMDCWAGCSPAAALLDTIANLERVGLVTTGAGANLAEARAPALFTVDTTTGPVTFAFVAYDSIAAAFYAAGPDFAGTAPLETAFVREDVAIALELADHVIVGAGWGVEYTSDPIDFQRENAGAAIEAGASVVLGNHPHWVQAVEHFLASQRTSEAPGISGTTEVSDALVAYSFGNFVFDQDWSVETTHGMAMDLGFTVDRLIGYRIRPILIRGDPTLTRGLYRPEFVDPATEGAPILKRIWDAQDRLPPR